MNPSMVSDGFFLVIYLVEIPPSTLNIVQSEERRPADG